MRLNDWQQAIEAYLLGADAAPTAALQASLIGSPNLSVTQGLAIYQHAYRARLLGVLREDFPAVRYWLGDEDFAALVQAYLAANPSQHFSLRWLGERFAGFIAQHYAAEAAAPLVELANLEWAFTLAFDAPEGPYGWLTRTVFLGKANRRADAIATDLLTGVDAQLVNEATRLLETVRHQLEAHLRTKKD